MNLAEARADIVLDQDFGPRHRLLGGQRLPGIRTEMVPTEQNAISRQAGAIGNAMDKVAEARRFHAGVAAILIDLVGRRLDQRERRSGPQDMAKRRHDHQRMRGADGKYAARLAGLVTRDEVEDGLQFMLSAIRRRLRRRQPVCLGAKECASILLNPKGRIWLDLSRIGGDRAEGNAPTARRRTVLKLLAGSIAGAGLSGLGRASRPRPTRRRPVGDAMLSLEFDSSCAAALSRGKATARVRSPISTPARHSGSRRQAHRSLPVPRPAQRARGRRARPGHAPCPARALPPEGIEKEISIVLYDRHSRLCALERHLSQRGHGGGPHRGLDQRRACPEAGSGGALDYWSFSGASYADRRDWVQPLHDGFDQRNFMGMNATDYGGGTPVVDVWRRDCGLAVGHVGRCRSS